MRISIKDFRKENCFKPTLFRKIEGSTTSGEGRQ
jgi:hypothetical protein